MAIGDLITKTRDGGDPVVATVDTPRSGGGTSLSCDDLDNWPQDTVHFITYKKTAAGGIDYDTLQTFKGIVSGNTIGTVTLQHSPTGSDLGNANGDYVEMAPTASWSQDLYDGFTEEHGVDGKHDNTKVVMTSGAQTIAGVKTFSSIPVLPANTVDTTQLADGAATDDKWRNGIAFRVTRNAAESTGNSAYAKIEFDTETYDLGSDFDPTTNFRFTAPVNGVYHFDASCTVTADGSARTAQLALYVDGSQYQRFGRNLVSASQQQFLSGGADIQLTAGQYVEVYAYANVTLPLIVGAGNDAPWFSGHLVTRTS